MIHYVCKYTPVELLNAFGEECAVLEEMPENFEMSDQIAHANLCGFGKSVIQAVLEGKADAALAASVFHFGEIKIPDLKSYLCAQGVAMGR